MMTELTDAQMEQIEEAAAARVNASETLEQYRDIILDYDWSNRYEHLQWIAVEPEAGIIAWAEDIRRDERAQTEAYA